MTVKPDEQPLDYVIVGQGIAGTTLAWQLKWRGLHGLIVDRDEGQSASRVAAGLMTPVTGQRLVPAWRLEECWSSAERFYRRVEAETGSQFFTQPGQVRLFDSQESKNDFDRRDWSTHPVEIRRPQQLVNPDAFAAPFGGFELPTAGRLDVAAYLADSRRSFLAESGFRVACLDSKSGLEIDQGIVHLPKLNVRAKRVIFCRGAAEPENSWFDDVVFKSARGEILTLRIAGLAETRIVNQGVWLVPCGNGLFKAGSTYDFENLQRGTTASGRDEITERLKAFMKLPFEVVGHESGVRPIVTGRQPVIGIHPEHSPLGIFNGLGSKGSLLAPFVANQFADFLSESATIDPELNVQERFPTRPADLTPAAPLKIPRLTEQAHEIIRSTVRPGDTVVDATAGNGYDTCFLAETVGSNGRVFAFDVQPVAIQRTTDRVTAAGLSNVNLLQRSHVEMKRVIPEKYHGQLSAVMFNLGYLPGGDHSVTTETQSSLTAIQSSLELVRPGGVVTILAYPGHSGGNDEAASVQRMIDELPAAGFETSVRRSATTRETAPLLFVIARRESPLL